MTRRTPSFVALTLVAVVASACADRPQATEPEIAPQLSKTSRFGTSFLTERSALAELLVPGSVTPIVSAGDILPGGEQLVGLPDGIGVWGGRRFMNMYLNHEISGGSRVSRLAIDTRDLGVTAHEYTIDGSEGYDRLCSAAWVDAGDGFPGGYFFTGEETSDGTQLAIDARGNVTEMPWIGLYNHENQISVPGFHGHVVVLNFDDNGGRGVGRDGARSELYMYVARSSADVLRGRGQLYVFAADDADLLPNDLTPNAPIAGHWIPVPDATAQDAAALNQFADDELAFPFIRLEDGFYDKQWRTRGWNDHDRRRWHGRRGHARGNPAAYFYDTGRSSITDPDDGTPIDPWGSIYRVEFQDARDPAGATTLTLLARSTGPSTMWASPDNGDMTDDGIIMLQEDPANGPWEPSAGARPPAVFALQVGRDGALVDPAGTKVAQVVGGDCSDAGPGNCWETSGIVDASRWFGRGAWIFDVQAHDEPVADCPDCGEDGQVVLLKLRR